MGEREPLFNKALFKEGLSSIERRRADASTPAEKVTANLRYLRLIGVHALVLLSNLADRIPGASDQPKE